MKQIINESFEISSLPPARKRPKTKAQRKESQSLDDNHATLENLMYPESPTKIIKKKKLKKISEFLDENHATKSVNTNNSKRNKSYTGPWQCYICGEIHENKNVNSNHIKEKHFPIVKNSMFGPPREDQCEKCKIMFSSKNLLTLHVCGQMPPSWIGQKNTGINISHENQNFSGIDSKISTLFRIKKNLKTD